MLQRLFGWFSSHESSGRDNYDSDTDVAVQTATLGDADPAPTERQTTFHQSLNTDARTCQDVISELGYEVTSHFVFFLSGICCNLAQIERSKENNSDRYYMNSQTDSIKLLHAIL